MGSENRSGKSAADQQKLHMVLVMWDVISVGCLSAIF